MFRRRIDSTRDRCASVCSKAFHNAEVCVHDQLHGCLLRPQPHRHPVVVVAVRCGREAIAGVEILRRVQPRLGAVEICLQEACPITLIVRLRQRLAWKDAGDGRVSSTVQIDTTVTA